MQRFFVRNTPLVVAQTIDLTPLAHQLHSVLRLTVDAEVVLLDGAGFEYPTRLLGVGRSQATGLILARRRVPNEPRVAITLYQCSLKSDKFEWVLQKGTELGVSHFVPVISERSMVRPATTLLKKYNRWHEIVREAAEQCGRGVLPLIDDPLLWPAVAQQEAGMRLLAWETVAGDQATIGLGDAIASPSVGGQQEISLAIGPEGGLTSGEVAMAVAAGWQVVSLGPRILRAETAALAAVSIVLDRLGDMGSRDERSPLSHDEVTELAARDLTDCA